MIKQIVFAHFINVPAQIDHWLAVFTCGNYSGMRTSKSVDIRSNWDVSFGNDVEARGTNSLCFFDTSTFLNWKICKVNVQFTSKVRRI